eukprot:TRINITY_DN2320_c2_g1_i1.p1 TRINITY_DN2320_c2_g1~~TRINITY_DN2320_c2_g1_i1.p1  ORF type:complete len:355 (+),score=82.08 TRINITY_DN2320_c2_g1_i1:7-1071(+)
MKRTVRQQVKAACVNCRKKHHGCDNNRPCLKCVKAGIADSCVDAPISAKRKRRLDSAKNNEQNNQVNNQPTNGQGSKSNQFESIPRACSKDPSALLYKRELNTSLDTGVKILSFDQPSLVTLNVDSIYNVEEPPRKMHKTTPHHNKEMRCCHHEDSHSCCEQRSSPPREDRARASPSRSSSPSSEDSLRNSSSQRSPLTSSTSSCDEYSSPSDNYTYDNTNPSQEQPIQSPREARQSQVTPMEESHSTNNNYTLQPNTTQTINTIPTEQQNTTPTYQYEQNQYDPENMYFSSSYSSPVEDSFNWSTDHNSDEEQYNFFNVGDGMSDASPVDPDQQNSEQSNWLIDQFFNESYSF